LQKFLKLTVDTALIDLRSARWTPLEQGELIEIRKLLAEVIAYTEQKKKRLSASSARGTPVGMHQSLRPA
jgi:hypothetical protein